MDNYKSSTHWQALNRIWKALPSATREGVKADFQLLTEWIKNAGSATAAPSEGAQTGEYDFETNFLDGMSRETKKFALKCLTQDKNDVYKGIMDFIAVHKIADMDALWEKYTAANAFLECNEAALREIMCVCLERARIQNLV